MGVSSLGGAVVVDVLVVDDNVNVRDSTAEVLRSFGLTVATAATLMKAEAIVLSSSVSVAVVDYAEAEAWAEQSYAYASWPPIIVLSARDADALRGLDAEHPGKFAALLEKPVSPIALHRAVRSVMGTQDAQLRD